MSNMIWTAEIDGILLDALLEEQGKENIISGVLTTIAFVNIASEFTHKIGFRFQKDHIRVLWECKEQSSMYCFGLGLAKEMAWKIGLQIATDNRLIQKEISVIKSSALSSL